MNLPLHFTSIYMCQYITKKSRLQINVKNTLVCNQDFTVPGRDPHTISMRLYYSFVYILKDSLIYFNREALISRCLSDMTNHVFGLEKAFDHIALD